MAARRSVAAPTAIEIMTTSIQVLENRLKRNRMAATRQIFLFSLTVRKSLLLISIGLRPPSQRAR
jgi:NTE family protein